MGATGLEPTHVTSDRTSDLRDSDSPSGAESGAVGVYGGVIGASEADLARVVAAWPTLPAAMRSAILAMVKASHGPQVTES